MTMADLHWGASNPRSTVSLETWSLMSWTAWRYASHASVMSPSCPSGPKPPVYLPHGPRLSLLNVATNLSINKHGVIEGKLQLSASVIRSYFAAQGVKN